MSRLSIASKHFSSTTASAGWKLHLSLHSFSVVVDKRLPLTVIAGPDKSRTLPSTLFSEHQMSWLFSLISLLILNVRALAKWMESRPTTMALALDSGVVRWADGRERWRPKFLRWYVVFFISFYDAEDATHACADGYYYSCSVQSSHPTRGYVGMAGRCRHGSGLLNGHEHNVDDVKDSH